MDPEQRLAVIQRGVVREMARYGREFTVDGAVVRGPGSTAVAVRDHPGPDGGHVDLGFVLTLGSAEAPVLWDCTAGLGTTEEEKLDSAVRMWAGTTAAAVVEFLEREGRHGDHLRLPALPGWQAVQGPATVFGFQSARLSTWLGGRELMAELAPALAPELTDPRLNGVKLFLGGRAGDEVAEVRVNGTVAQTASQALGSLDWPRGERFCWARLFVLLAADRPGLAAVRAAETEPPLPLAYPPAHDPAAAGTMARRREAIGRWWRTRRAGQ
ncbi:hypothetical protein ABH930_003721 [Kitasatospora sp. GAS204A]|uniref:DUF6348 family protein n=1 Tax=unclassified Kitasatospora TaxID=2633591 RepID=UPI002473BCC5|nr:DUF6348 family protein [Kitasatospora sp. GAS204B]MDH6118776.1 hypothetical protein [Kitasatospora sp. GAS204B]